MVFLIVKDPCRKMFNEQRIITNCHEGKINFLKKRDHVYDFVEK